MEEGILALIIMPFVIFMIFVAPIWLILHYRSKKQMNQGLSPDDYRSLKELAATAERMSDRIETLESILDSEAPEWRNRA